MLDPHEALHEELSDRYELEDVLGQGGMGTVYLARDRKHDRLVAIKTIIPDLAAGVGAQRFQREIQITAHLQHPHILPLLDSGAAGETLYYVMPLVEGESLRNRLDREGRLPVEDVVRIARDVLEALEYAHGRDVIHRDIKPDNILLGERHALLVDFGIAKALIQTEDKTLTGAGRSIGSPGYMAPEQLAGHPSPASDLYAVGAVVYEALTGTRWKPTASLDEADWTGVPPALKAVISRALGWLPADRWQDAADFRRALVASVATSKRRQTVALGGLAALLLAAATWWAASSLGGARPVDPAGVPPRSIAVRPLENLTGDEETEYFSDGITEDIIAQLSKVRDLKVISRTSIMQYKLSDKTAREIGAELNVATVLEGTVRRQGDRVRIVSQLIDAASDEHLWAETYDRELTDVFDLQSEVAQDIARALQATISPGERSLMQRRPTDDVEAHNLYLRGRYQWNRRTRAGLESAVDYFDQATGRDSAYGPAWAGLADAYLLLGSYQYMAEPEAIIQTKLAVGRALALDERLAEAHATRGQVLRSERDWAGEERAYLRAIELNPNYATAHQWYATLLAALDRPEDALREIRRAEVLDPLSIAISVTHGVVLFVNGDYAGAIEQLNRTLELDPNYFSALVWLLDSYIETGRPEDALAAYERLIEQRPDIPQWEFYLAYLYARTSHYEQAVETLARARTGADDPVLSAMVYAALYERDRALDLLESTLADESWSMFVFFRALLFYMNVGPWFDPLRSDPRFDALLEQMNFR